MIPKKCTLPLKAKFKLILNSDITCEGMSCYLYSDKMYASGGGVNYTVRGEYASKFCKDCPKREKG